MILVGERNNKGLTKRLFVILDIGSLFVIESKNAGSSDMKAIEN